jgi:mRNA interferase YafQ
MRSLHDAGLFERPIPLFEAETRERDLRAIGDGVRAIGVCSRECHIRPDLRLIYRKADAYSLELARLGSHSQLFG